VWGCLQPQWADFIVCKGAWDRCDVIVIISYELPVGVKPNPCVSLFHVLMNPICCCVSDQAAAGFYMGWAMMVNSYA
jgi:hypothetical protein